MQPDDDAPLILSKWPFYIGDILLVLTALAIAILGKWQLTDMQVVSCVLAVALGAAIFVLPYIVEHSMRVREVSDDRDAEIRMFKGYLQKAELALGQYHERLQELESGSGSVDQRCELLASAVDQKLLVESERVTKLLQQLTALESSTAEQPNALAVLKTQMEALLEKTQEPELPSEALLALQAAQADLEARSTQTQVSLAAIETFKTEQAAALAELKDQLAALGAKAQESVAPGEAVVTLQAEVTALATRLAESVESLAAIEARLVAVEANASPTEAEDERPTRASRKHRVKSDSGLLHRAIQVRSDSTSSAVSRIIDSKNRLAEPEPEPSVEAGAKEVSPELEETEAKAVVEDGPVVETPSVEESAAEGLSKEPAVKELVVELDPAEATAQIDELPEEIEVSLGADLIEDDELLEAEARAAEQAQVESKPEPEAVPVASEEPVVDVDPEVATVPEAQVESEVKADQSVESEPKPSKAKPGAKAEAKDLFGEVESPPVRRARTKVDDAIFTVSILIGIGNKPFLRGSGGGLSWESGIPMEFEEIGKWRWIAPADLEAPIELQVFRNDEDADRKGRYTLNPGQQLEVSPVF